MPFEIRRNPDPPREIRMGGPKPQPPPMENKQGRKKMAEEKKLGHETGVEKVSQEKADKQGPVGTGAQRPAREPDAEVKIGGQEEKANG